MNIYEKLMNIQCELKAPKNLHNSFGKYKYRNAEGILEAVKPYLTKHKCSMVISDDVVEIGGRLFVRSNAILTDCENVDADGMPLTIGAVALAEIDAHKGMSLDQCTGTASSYARKYCLNGLFLLDDTKDADTDELHEELESKNSKKVTDAQIKKIRYEMGRTGVTEQKITEMFKVDAIENLSSVDASKCIEKLTKTKDKE